MTSLLELNEFRDIDEIPVSAAIVDVNFKTLFREKNQKASTTNPLGHAEAVVISQACAEMGTMNLCDFTLVTTLEPCPMCSFLIRKVRIGRVIFGATSTAQVTDLYDVLRDPRLGKVPEIISGVLGEECSAQLSNWFDDHRGTKL